jgi:hypothetical protein
MLLPEHFSSHQVLKAKSNISFDPSMLPLLGAGRVEGYAFPAGLASCSEKRQGFLLDDGACPWLLDLAISIRPAALPASSRREATGLVLLARGVSSFVLFWLLCDLPGGLLRHVL